MPKRVATPHSRPHPRWRRALISVLAVSLGWSLTPETTAKKKDRDAGRSRQELSEWIEGPVRYISRPEEIDQFEALAKDSDRALFIERFWQRRDRSPETLSNEYRQLFWERVQQANQSFHSTRAGWMTDRGKIYILYGPPTDTQEDIFLQSDRNPSGGAGVLRWIYEGRPGERMDLDPITVVAFTRDNTLEYKVSYDPKLNSVYFQPHANQDTPFAAFYDALAERSRSELSVMLDLGKLQEVPPQEQVLLERIETLEIFETHQLDVSIDRFEHPDKDGTLIVTTVDVGQSRDASAVLARFDPRDATQKPRLIGEGSFRIEGAGGTNVAQGLTVLAPGTYDLTILVADAMVGSTGMYRGPVVVPPSEGGLRLSDITLAQRIESVPYRAMVSYEEPFRIGPMKVVPRFGSEIGRGEIIDLLFEIYGGTTPYTVSFELEGQETDGSWVPLGQAQTLEQSERTVAWGLQSDTRWPLGEYRVKIDVADAEGATRRALAPFDLIEEARQ